MNGNKSLSTQRASAVVSQVIADQGALTVLLNTSNNTLDGVHIVNFASPTGISGLARGDLIYKKGAVNLIYATFAEAAPAYVQLISPGNYTFVIKNGTSWVSLASVAISGSYLDLSNKPSGLIETGTYLYSTASSLTGFLECIGANVSRTTYSNLFSVIGTSFGIGDGSTTFGTPDLRGRVPGGIGQGSGLLDRTIGTYVGAETHTLTLAESPARNQNGLSLFFNDGTSGTSAGTVVDSNYNFAAGTTKKATINEPQGGSGQAHNNMQPTLFGGRWFIKI